MKHASRLVHLPGTARHEKEVRRLEAIIVSTLHHRDSEQQESGAGCEYLQ
jgi:hypothetical protein